ncbi:MAG: thioredoxin family protein [Bacteroidales bacterium]
MEIKILGTGCSKCKALEESARVATKELGLDAVITKVEDISEIMSYNVMRTPALLIDDKIISQGAVKSVKDMKKILAKSIGDFKVNID